MRPLLQGGADDVKKHKWFKGIDWDALYNRQIPVRDVATQRWLISAICLPDGSPSRHPVPFPCPAPRAPPAPVRAGTDCADGAAPGRHEQL